MNVISLLFHDVYATDPHESGFRSPGADRYKLSIPDFEAQLDGLSRIRRAGSRFPAVITFDDGGESYYTAAADRLESRGWRGHCFVTTECVGQRGFLTPAQIRELDGRGHQMGSHSASHPARFSTLPFAQMLREWHDSRKALEDLLGRAVTTASVPGGYFSRKVASAAAESGLRVLFTSEPTSRMSSADGCEIIGRFTIRRGHAADMAHRLAASRWTRGGAWAGWNAKAIVKPLLGPSYTRVADWLLTSRTSSDSAPGTMFRFATAVAIASMPLLLAAQGTGPSDHRSAPELPRVAVEIPDLKTEGRTIHVVAGGSLQQAIDQAKSGDRIELDPRATYEGPFHLKPKDGDRWIVIASSAAPPRPGRHVEPSDAAMMPKLVSSGDFVVSADPGAHHYRLVGLEIAPKAGSFVTSILQFGDREASPELVPHHLIVDRCYVHGDAKIGGRRGVALNAANAAVIDSYLSDFKEVGADSQAIGGWNGPGPFRIAGNYLEAAGENIMFGGGDPRITNLVPSDIEVVHNHLSKPLRWKKGDPAFEGIEWSVKNLFELKNARRVLVDGNLLEYNWPQSQNGFSILFTVRNQEGGAPWSTIEDVTFSNNLVRHVAAGINVLGHDDNQASQQAQRIAVRNNLFLDVGGAWGGGRLFQLLDGTNNVTFDHNTAFQTGGILFGGDHAPHTGFVFQNNVVTFKENGINGSGTGEGTGTLTHYFPNAIVRRNVIVGANASQYPADNFFPKSLEEAGITMPRNGEVRPGPGLARPYTHAATDGRDPGADVSVIARALDGIAEAAPQPRAAAQADAMGLAALLWWPGNRVMFWLSLALLVYVYFGYPLLAGLRAALLSKPSRKAAIEPSVSIIVIVHNEAERIGTRIENLLALDYPRDRLEIVVGSDGSTDDTVARARQFEPQGVRVQAFREHRGKPAIVNALVPVVRGEIVVFADARQRFEAGALRALVANFADANVGAASGELMMTAGDGTASAGHGSAFYWRYEKFIRSAEGRVDSTVGATGAIYSIRRDLFEPIPEDTLLDDVLIPLRIIRLGYRVVFEPEARAHDSASATGRQEFVRKTRTIAGMFQLLSREGWLLNPFGNRLWFETISHKVLRLALPMLHAMLLVSSIALADVGFYGLLLAGQVVFYAAALVGATQRQTRRRSIVFTASCAMCLLIWATIVGFVRFITHRQRVTWERVPATFTS